MSLFTPSPSRFAARTCTRRSRWVRLPSPLRACYADALLRQASSTTTRVRTKMKRRRGLTSPRRHRRSTLPTTLASNSRSTCGGSCSPSGSVSAPSSLLPSVKLLMALVDQSASLNEGISATTRRPLSRVRFSSPSSRPLLTLSSRAVFSIMFEISSAYGTVGLSLGTTMVRRSVFCSLTRRTKASLRRKTPPSQALSDPCRASFSSPS